MKPDPLSPDDLAEYRAQVDRWREFEVSSPMMVSATAVDVAEALLAHINALTADLAAYRRAKAENDERFMIERDEALLAHIDALTADLAAYRRAKAENDERFMIERDEARRERDAARRLLGGPPPR